MTVQTALQEGQNKLFYAEVDTPLLDAMVLLSEALGISKESMLAALPETLNESGYSRYRSYIDQRCSGLPVSYIRRRKEFFSLEFYVDERVLVPRPDTEIMVEQALVLLQERSHYHRVHDACTGSGCIAVALKHVRPELDITMSDISPLCLEVARRNALEILGKELPCCVSNLLRDVSGLFDMIVANPPYLTDKEVDDMHKIGWPEPELALRGGNDGTWFLEKLILQAAPKLNPGGVLLLELDPGQIAKLTALVRAAGFSTISICEDLAGRQRVLIAEV